MTETDSEIKTEAGPSLPASPGSGNPAAAARHDGETLSRDADISPLTPYYQDALCTIYHGDCRDVLPRLEMADLVLTDPPYGVGENAHRIASRTKLAKTTDYGNFDWDKEPADDAEVALTIIAGRQAIIWGGNYFKLPPSRGWLVWDKQNSGNFADAELAWTNLKTSVRLFRFLWNGMIRGGEQRGVPRVHPTQKPVELMRWCLGFAPEARTVIDPFMGSGTTLRAAKDLNRTAIGIETDERYCEIAANRLAQEVLNFAGGDADFGVTDSNISSQAELLDSPNVVFSDPPKEASDV